MKANLRRMTGIASLLALVGVGCGNSTDGNVLGTTENVAKPSSVTQGLNLPAASDVPLNAHEIESLQFMREEEKVARDVYLALNDAWQVNVFSNIAKSEQSHMDAIAVLLDRYGIDDPALGQPVGVFQNSDLQKLYDDLVAKGQVSVQDALQVGALIEEVDIKDLVIAKEGLVHEDVIWVYENLISGSENHLRAFTGTLLSQTGEVYVPQVLDVLDYELILATGTGNAQGGNGNARRGGRW